METSAYLIAKCYQLHLTFATESVSAMVSALALYCLPINSTLHINRFLCQAYAPHFWSKTSQSHIPHLNHVMRYVKLLPQVCWQYRASLI